MRRFLDGRGVDSSEAARAYLAQHRGLTLPDLYVINTAPSLVPPLLHVVDPAAVESAVLYTVTTHIQGVPHPTCATITTGLAVDEPPAWLNIAGMFAGAFEAYTARTDSTRWHSDTQTWAGAEGIFPTPHYPDVTKTVVSFYDWESCIFGCSHNSPADKFVLLDCWMDITNADGSTARLRPTRRSIQPNDDPLKGWVEGHTIWKVFAGGDQDPVVQVTAFVDERDMHGSGFTELVEKGVIVPGTGFLLTDYPSSLVWDYRGQFKTAVISRDEVSSKIGFEADTLKVTWRPKDSDTLARGKITALAAFGFGMFDNGVLEVWRACMPQPGDLVGSPWAPAVLGDVNSLGASLIFSGRIGDVTPTRDGVEISVVSRMETLNVEVPTNLIEPTNVYAASSVGVMPDGGVPKFTVEPGSTNLVIFAAELVAKALYTDGYLFFLTGDLQGFHARVLAQTVVAGKTAFMLGEALPFAPETGDTLRGLVGLALDSTATRYGGFRWVPSPDNSAVII